MKTFHCNRCNKLVFFENTHCENCGARLGYVPEINQISAFEETDDGRWRSLHPLAKDLFYRPCHNYAVENVCNWVVPAPAPDTPEALCCSCQLTSTIPNLSTPENRVYWYRIEAAKRRLLYTFSELGLSVKSRQEDPERGLEFQFLEGDAQGHGVMTGHNNGIITLNIAEADDAHREKTRSALHEPYRTLLGHFRHESGHYFFDRLIADTARIAPFRTAFGDEQADYAAALDRHYKEGPPAQWEDNFISAYATMHPWEDWAETWAHYLHIVDTLDTAVSCGLVLVPDSPHEPTLTDQTPVEETTFDNLMKRWFPLTYVLNSLNRSLGMPDGYPFTLAPAVIDKLRFVHRVVAAASAKR
jgi:hypothetical protein